MSNYNEMIGDKVYTDCGEYTIITHVHDDMCTGESVNLYVGKAADGHHDMIASDSASMWVVGNEDDAELNRDHWCTIAERCDVAPVIDEVRKIDADLADWLAARYNEAQTALVIIDRADYDNGNTGDGAVVNCHIADIYDAIAERWSDIGADDIIVRGIGRIDDLEALHLADVDSDTRTIDGLRDLVADYYVAPYSREEGDGDCGDWEYYALGGRRLTTAEAFGESASGSIGDRFPPCHNPELRWIPGDYDSLHISSGLHPLDDGEETVCKFEDVGDFCVCAGSCSPDTVLTDAQWHDILAYMARDMAREC